VHQVSFIYKIIEEHVEQNIENTRKSSTVSANVWDYQQDHLPIYDRKHNGKVKPN